MTNYLNLIYVRGVQRPGLLNADSVGILSNGEGLTVASTLFLQNSSFEYLNSFTVSLFDLSVYLNSISYAN